MFCSRWLCFVGYIMDVDRGITMPERSIASLVPWDTSDLDISDQPKQYFTSYSNYFQLSYILSLYMILLTDWLYLEESRKLKKFVLDDYVDKTKKGIQEKDRCTYVLTQNPYLIRSLAFAYPKTSILPTLFDPV